MSTVPFPATIRSEWTKLESLRSSRVVAVLTVLLSIALGALIAVIIGRTWDDWPAAEQAAFDSVDSARIGNLAVVLPLTGLGVTAGSSEYASGQIRLTLAATPRRGRVLAAKALVVLLATLAVGLLAGALTFLVTQSVLAVEGIPWAGLGTDDVWQTVLVDGLMAPILPLLGLALGLALRSAAAAVSAVLGLLFVIPIIGALLPTWWQEHVMVYLPGAASDVLANAHLEHRPDLGALPPVWAALLLTVGWLAVFLGGAWWALERRDA